ncbi:cytochrome P450 [Acaromyces ingoldii]|uniref:Cytochrome P450 n=1 Tax=Acaromyces ingoldii TaxID=215250 RepID=A0A316YC90_9BASI|nr:cytochrome P450 [Acaromyces ingoldii]PWN86514.1 cytochrome P450 [Acaromyces ingoldii]
MVKNYTIVHLDWVGHDDKSASKLITATLVAVLVAYVTYNLFLHPLAGIPGPFISRSGLWSYRVNRAIFRDASQSYDKLHDDYGAYVRIGRNHVMTADPAAVNVLYGHSSKWTKSGFYHLFRLGPPKGIMSETDVKKHAALRRASSSAYSISALLELEVSVDIMVEKLFRQLDGFVERKQPWNAGLWLQWFAMDVVGDLAFGKNFGLIEKATDTNNLIPAVEDFVFVATLMGTFPTIGDPLFTAASAAGAGGRGAAHLMQVTQESVKARLKRAEEIVKAGGTTDELQKDMLSRFLRAKDPETGKKLTVDQICTSATQVVGAGSDTTAITMRAIIYYTLVTPGVYEKLMEELEAAVSNGSLTFPTPYNEGVKLEYFQAIVKEALRYYPAVPWPMPRVAPEGGAHIGDHYFPPGSRVGMSAYAYHRRAYGHDSKRFRPERWIEATDEEKKEMEKNLLSFGGGARVCIGRNISIMEMTKVIPYLFWTYHFSITPRGPGSPHKYKQGRGSDGVLDSESWYVKSSWFSSQYDFFLDVKKRDVEAVQ